MACENSKVLSSSSAAFCTSHWMEVGMGLDSVSSDFVRDDDN